MTKAALTTALLLLASCSSPTISLQSALVQTVQALHAAHEESLRLGPIGYYPCTLTAIFQLGMSADGKLEASQAATLGASASSSSTVQVVMKARACGATGVEPLLTRIGDRHD